MILIVDNLLSVVDSGDVPLEDANLDAEIRKNIEKLQNEIFSSSLNFTTRSTVVLQNDRPVGSIIPYCGGHLWTVSRCNEIIRSLRTSIQKFVISESFLVGSDHKLPVYIKAFLLGKNNPRSASIQILKKNAYNKPFVGRFRITLIDQHSDNPRTAKNIHNNFQAQFEGNEQSSIQQDIDVNHIVQKNSLYMKNEIFQLFVEFQDAGNQFNMNNCGGFMQALFAID